MLDSTPALNTFGVAALFPDGHAATETKTKREGRPKVYDSRSHKRRSVLVIIATMILTLMIPEFHALRCIP